MPPQIDTSNVASSTADILNITDSNSYGQILKGNSPPVIDSKSPKSMTSFNMRSVPWHQLTEEEKEEKRDRARKRVLQRESSNRLYSSITRRSLLSLIEDEVSYILRASTIRSTS